jgi:pyridoxal phosphate enzyme (YggS family)
VESSRIRELLAAGATHLGENKVQDFLPKYNDLREENCIWHFIGHLQRNKVKHIVDKVALIHSVDSISLAEEINRQGEKRNITINILVEVNITENPEKFGVFPDNLQNFIENLSKFPFIGPKGLMCIAPFTEIPEENRPFFSTMRSLLVATKRKNMYNDFDILSMGMTNDCRVATEEGATHVRIGTALFGERS